MEPLCKNMRVKCDTPGCGWSLEIEPHQITDFHNVLCPKCQKCIIVNDEDLSLFYAMMSIASMGRAMNEGKPSDSWVRVDSAPLRNDKKS